MAKPSNKADRETSRHVRDQIEQNLKRVYDETVEEPLPEKLAELVERLKRQGKP